MPQPIADQPLLPSVLDRLIDYEPKVTTEPPAARSRVLAQIKAAVKRDLEWLLNTKATLDLTDATPPLVASLLNFGLPDFTHSSLSSGPDQARLRAAVEAAIRRFEPRLTDVAVVLVEGQQSERALRFRIDALLKIDPAPEPVSFDSVLQLQNKAFRVQGDGE
jgi:type VI secretion system protein ImpF